MTQNATSAPIKINRANIDLGEALPRKIQDELMNVAESCYGHLNHAVVGFTRDGNWYCCTINVHVGNLKVIVAESSAVDCHSAFDQALAKIGRQLLRRKQGSRVRMPAPVLA